MKSRRRYFHIYNKTTIAQFFGKILKCARYQMSYQKNFPRPKINKDEIKKGGSVVYLLFTCKYAYNY